MVWYETQVLGQRKHCRVAERVTREDTAQQYGKMTGQESEAAPCYRGSKLTRRKKQITSTYFLYDSLFEHRRLESCSAARSLFDLPSFRDFGY